MVLWLIQFIIVVVTILTICIIGTLFVAQFIENENLQVSLLFITIVLAIVMSIISNRAFTNMFNVNATTLTYTSTYKFYDENNVQITNSYRKDYFVVTDDNKVIPITTYLPIFQLDDTMYLEVIETDCKWGFIKKNIPTKYIVHIKDNREE